MYGKTENNLLTIKPMQCIILISPFFDKGDHGLLVLFYSSGNQYSILTVCNMVSDPLFRLQNYLKNCKPRPGGFAILMHFRS